MIIDNKFLSAEDIAIKLNLYHKSDVYHTAIKFKIKKIKKKKQENKQPYTFYNFEEIEKVYKLRQDYTDKQIKGILSDVDNVDKLQYKLDIALYSLRYIASIKPSQQNHQFIDSAIEALKKIGA